MPRKFKPTIEFDRPFEEEIDDITSGKLTVEGVADAIVNMIGVTTGAGARSRASNPAQIMGRMFGGAARAVGQFRRGLSRIGDQPKTTKELKDRGDRIDFSGKTIQKGYLAVINDPSHPQYGHVGAVAGHSKIDRDGKRAYLHHLWPIAPEGMKKAHNLPPVMDARRSQITLMPTWHTTHREDVPPESYDNYVDLANQYELGVEATRHGTRAKHIAALLKHTKTPVHWGSEGTTATSEAIDRILVGQDPSLLVEALLSEAYQTVVRNADEPKDYHAEGDPVVVWAKNTTGEHPLHGQVGTVVNVTHAEGVHKLRNKPFKVPIYHVKFDVGGGKSKISHFLHSELGTYSPGHMGMYKAQGGPYPLSGASRGQHQTEIHDAVRGLYNTGGLDVPEGHHVQLSGITGALKKRGTGPGPWARPELRTKYGLKQLEPNEKPYWIPGEGPFQGVSVAAFHKRYPHLVDPSIKVAPEIMGDVSRDVLSHGRPGRIIKVNDVHVGEHEHFTKAEHMPPEPPEEHKAKYKEKHGVDWEHMKHTETSPRYEDPHKLSVLRQRRAMGVRQGTVDNPVLRSQDIGTAVAPDFSVPSDAPLDVNNADFLAGQETPPD